MLEKRFAAVTPQAVIANGTTDGKITVQDTGLFKVKQKVFLYSNTQQSRDNLEIKKVLNETEMIIGPEKTPIHVYSDMSDFLVSDSSFIGSNEQFRPSIPIEEISRAVYDEEPTVALRSSLVDKTGNKYGTENPFPVQLTDGSVNIGTVNAELEVQLSHKDNYPDVGDVADSVRIGNGVYELKVNSDGSIDVNADISTTNIDIRNLNAPDDNVAISDGTNIASVTSDNALKVDGSAVTQPISGSVDIGNFPAVQSISGSVTANQGTNPWVVSGSVFTTPAVGTLDAFARQRVSEPYTLGDYKHLYGIDPNFIDYTLNGGTISFQSNKACARLTTSSDVNSKTIHQTKCYHHYMPGKSQLIMSSFNFYSSTSGVTKRTGLFDDNNGIYFEQTGNGTLNIVLRSYVNGAVNENRVSQINWNVDKCDGTGISSLNLDITKTQLLFIDFQWLGVGRVRVGFSHEGRYIEAHHFDGENNLDTVYMSNPNLPVRCEIFNTGTTTGAYMDQICSTVVSEGGYVEAGIDWALASPTPRLLGIGQTLPILAIRLKNNYKTYLNRMLARLGQVTVFTDSGNVQFSIAKLQNASNLIGGAGVWTSVNSESGVEYLADATGYTNADILSVGFAASASNGESKAGSNSNAVIPSSAKKNYIVQNFDSTSSEVYVILVKNIDTKATNISAGLQWREIY